MKSPLFIAALALAVASVHAQQTPPCPPGTVTCNQSTQTMGDTTQTASADNDQSQTTQAGGHSNSIASGVTIDPKVQQSGNAVTQSGNHVSSGATGGAAIGNESHNDNHSSATTGASSASNGNMTGLGGAGGSVGNVAPVGNSGTIAPVANGGTSASRVGDVSSGSVSDAANHTRIGDVGSTSLSSSGGNDTRSASTTSVDASDRSVTNSRSNFTVLSDQPAVPMSFSPSAQVTATADPECGPVQSVISTPLYGYFFGAFKTKRVELDHNDTLAPPDAAALNSEWGARAIYTTSVVNVTGARGLSLGGGGNSGWGQGSGGASSSMTVMVTHITLRACRLVQPQQKVLVIHDAPQVDRPAPIVHRVHRKRAPAPCPPVKK